MIQALRYSVQLIVENTAFCKSLFGNAMMAIYIYSSVFTLDQTETKKWFVDCYPSTKTIPDQAGLEYGGHQLGIQINLQDTEPGSCLTSSTLSKKKL